MSQGSNGGRGGESAAVHARAELPDGERHGAQLGGDAVHMGLHVRREKAQHRPDRVQDTVDRAAHEPEQEPRETHRGHVREVRLPGLPRRHTGGAHTLRAGPRHRHCA